MEMTHRRLETVLTSYGAAPERWPAEERVAVLALLARSDTARRCWVDAAALDSVMESEVPPPPSEALVNRLKTIPATETAAQRHRLRPRAIAGFVTARRLVAVGALASLSIAFLVGLVLPSPFGGIVPGPAAPVTTVAADVEAPAILAETDIAIVDVLSGEESGDTAELENSDDDAFALATLDLPLE